MGSERRGKGIGSINKAQFAEDLNFYGFYSGGFCILSPRTSIAQSVFFSVLCGLTTAIQSHRINRDLHEQNQLDSMTNLRQILQGSSWTSGEKRCLWIWDVAESPLKAYLGLHLRFKYQGKASLCLVDDFLTWTTCSGLPHQQWYAFRHSTEVELKGEN